MNTSTHTTTMSDAFQRGGYRTPQQILHDNMKDAILRCNGMPQPSKGLFLSMLLTEPGAQLVWELFPNEIRESVLQKLYDSVLGETRHYKEQQRKAAERAADATLRAAERARHQQREWTSGSFNSRGGWSGTSPARPEPELSGAAAGRTPEAALRAASASTSSLLRTFMVNGKPIGDQTAGEVREWCDSRDHHTRFARMLAHGVPDKMLISQARTDDDAAKIFKLAAQEQAAD